jgi:hypothetical protein
MNTVGPPQGGFDSAAGTPPPPSPVAVQQTTVIQVAAQKSVAGAVVLAFFFGPLGMLYVTVSGALIMFVISFFVAFATLGLGLLITLPICAIWAGIAASSHNNRMQAMSTQQAMGGAAAVAPAGWHDDPQGSGRLRYFDGMRWTNHYAEQMPQQAPPAPPVKQLDEQTPQAVVEDASVEADEVEEPLSEKAEAGDAEQSEAGDVQTRVIEPEAEEPAATDTEGAAAEAPTAVVNAEPQRAFCGACGHSIAATARFCSACGETQAIS